MIPLGSPEVDQSGIEKVGNLLDSGLLSTGEVVADFEEMFSEFSSRERGVAVASGSIALELALEATFEKGDTVALSPYNCGSVLYSVQRAGLSPAFVDADPDTAALSADALRQTDHTIDGILLSHLFGHPADIKAILDIADTRDATIVEDFAQAPGATVNGRPVGSFGRVSICSFGATKNLTTAEGGMVVTDNEDIAEYVTQQRSNTGDVVPPPRSARMNDIEAAIGQSQLAHYDETINRKRSVASIYREELADVSVELFPVTSWATHVYHAFSILYNNADALAAHLRKNNVGTNRLYNTPLHKYEAAPPVHDSYPITERLANEVVLLPIHGQVTDAQAHTVAETVKTFCANQ